MWLLNARQLHNETSAVLDELSKGKSFRIERRGRIIGTLQPAGNRDKPGWEELMSEVWAAQKKAGGKTRNPVLLERARKRR
jgi:antitoxin (DNA-binding transcriptional repressor) of toxin-antitoxin stability system